jgi:hypothetical protein
MTRISDQGLAITNMEPGKRGTRAYFDVDDINAGATRVRELRGGGPAGPSAGHGLVRDLPGPAGQRVWPVADPIQANQRRSAVAVAVRAAHAHAARPAEVAIPPPGPIRWTPDIRGAVRR